MQFERDIEFHTIIADLMTQPEILKMCTISQHGNISCFGHSVFVSYLSYRICKTLSLDYRAAARGGLLHDLFLYDWHIAQSHEGLHAFSHPRAALNNATRICTLSAKEKDIIITHMWPVTPRSFYRYPESAIVSTVDKICALGEVFHIFHRNRLALRLGLSQRAYFCKAQH